MPRIHASQNCIYGAPSDGQTLQLPGEFGMVITGMPCYNVTCAWGKNPNVKLFNDHARPFQCLISLQRMLVFF